MPTDPRQSLETLVEKISRGERGGSPADRAELVNLSDNLDLIPSEVGDYRHRDIVRRNCILAEQVGGLAEAHDSRPVVERFVRYINREYDNEHTNQDYRKDLRMFGQYGGDLEDEVPEPFAWVPTGTSNDFDPRPSERDLITYDEHRAMVEDCRNARDAALIAVQFEGGLRSGELQTLRVGDVFESDHTTGLHVDGKQGERAVHLSVAVPQLTRWLTDHPGRDDPSAPLWSKLSTVDSISDRMFRKAFEEAAERADVTKPVTPTNFRKSNTRWLFKLGLDRGQIEQRQGRVHGSEHTARYEAEFGDDALETTYASLHGADVEQDTSGVDVAPVVCPRCSEATPREKDHCIHCNFSLDIDRTQKLSDILEHFEDRAVNEDDPDARADLIGATRTIRRQPSRVDVEDLHDVASGDSEES